VVAYQNISTGDANAVAAQPTIPGILGMATNAASAGGTVTVSSNGIVSGLSGLTAGATYYYGLTSGLTTTVETYKVGIAISSSAILLDSNSAAGADQFFGDAIFNNNFPSPRIPECPTPSSFKINSAAR